MTVSLLERKPEMAILRNLAAMTTPLNNDGGLRDSALSRLRQRRRPELGAAAGFQPLRGPVAARTAPGWRSLPVPGVRAGLPPSANSEGPAGRALRGRNA